MLKCYGQERNRIPKADGELPDLDQRIHAPAVCLARPFRLEGVLDAKNRAPREALRKPSRLARKVWAEDRFQSRQFIHDAQLYRIPGQAPLHQIAG